MTFEEIQEICREYADEIIELRRDLHKYPESGWLEFRTTAKVAKILESAGIPYRCGTDVISRLNAMGRPSAEELRKAKARALEEGADPEILEKIGDYTGLVATIDTGVPGPTIGMRFDMDCIEVMENMDERHRPFLEGFRSVHNGCDHSCGHDGHTAIGIITALVLQRIRNQLKGKFILLFQPAEEGVRGAKAMAAAGVLNGVDYFVSAHIAFKALRSNYFITGTNGFLATTKIDAYFTGCPAHAGAAPEQGCNALLAAASAAVNIHSQCQDGRGAARVNVGYLKAGTGRNVVPDSAVLKLETRGEYTIINEDMAKKAQRTLQAAASMYGVTVQTRIAGSASGGSSSPELARRMAGVVSRLFPEAQVVESYPLGGSEDVTYLMEAVQRQGGQAIFMMLGSEIKAPHHNGGFDFNENVLLQGVQIYTCGALELAARD